MNPEPTMTGPHGQAWKYDLEAFAKHFNTTALAGVASWVIRAPWANMLWHSYALHLIHLRPLEGKAPKIYRHGATHEIMLFALDPDWKVNLFEFPPHLQPINFAGQIIETDDAAAIERCQSAVNEVLRGELSPDTDWTQAWVRRFGNSMLKGDPDRVGETIITVESEGSKSELVYDPKSPDSKPIDRRCRLCGQPASPLHDLCFSCLKEMEVA